MALVRYTPQKKLKTKDIEAAIEKGRKYNPDDFNQSYFTSRLYS
jgi:hypothetical protein